MSKQYMRSVSSASIELGPIPFNLYAAERGDRLILFCRAGFPITADHKKRLRDIGRVLYIGGDDEASYLDYASERIERIVTSTEMRVEDKSKIIHDIGKRTVHRLLEDPRSGANVGKSQRIVENYTELIMRSPEVAGNLFALSSVDSYTFSHSLNVCTFCLMLGEKIYGADRDVLCELGFAGLMHDIGKTQVNQEILFKPSRLNDEEMEEMRKHAVYSYELICEHNLSKGVQAVGRSHHERMDGSGYPDGLHGKDIHPFARLTAVADVYDAITSDRIYRKQKAHVNALSVIAKDAHLFDPEVVDALVHIVLRNETLIERFRASYLKREPAADGGPGSQDPLPEEPLEAI